jgi:transcription antitermination factor NusG
MENKKALGNVKIAEDMSVEKYDEQPIDDFGKTMLYKMGWKENQRVGNKDPVKPVEFTPRPSGVGLGSVLLDTDKRSKKYKDKEERTTLYGTKVKIVEGKHKGLKGIIIEDISSLKEVDYIKVELKVNKQVLKIKSDYLKLRGKGKQNEKDENDKQSSQSLKVNKRSPLRWVSSNITVRIVNKDSKYYNTKAHVEDIIDAYSFSLITSDGLLHTNYYEDDLETVMPRINEPVKILVGKYKGEVATLMERDKKNNKIIVQLSDLTVETYSQDDCCAINTK